MSTRKTVIDIKYVHQFLIREFDDQVSNITPLQGGEMSCPFAFKANGIEYVIRIDPYLQSFLKDKYAWENFASDKLLIPEYIQMGKFDVKNHYIITRRAEGKILDNFSKDEMHSIMPSIVSTLDEIHKVDVSTTRGYGILDTNGIGSHKTWKEYVLSINDGIDEWKKKYLTNIQTNNIFERIYDKVYLLTKYCPEEKYLIHGDYGYNNVISDGKKITGVLDWSESRYGDFVFDVAWLDTWQEDILYEEIFRKQYEDQKKPIAYYSERIICYKILNYHSGLKFFAQYGELEKVKWLEGKLLNLLAIHQQ